jgi:xanthine dehydrogenase YagR molybdenum-binding subunit
MEQMPLIGQPLNRVDGRLKVTGKAMYSAEWNLPNLVYGAMVTSSAPSGRIRAIDSQAAERAPGVLAVMTHLNTPKLPQKPQGGESARPTDRKLQLLQDDIVRYSNQPIGVVVASTFEQAVHAAELLKVTYAVEPHLVTLDAAQGTRYIPEKTSGAGEPATTSRGDFKAAHAGAKTTLEKVYYIGTETHNPMEPHATIAVWDGPKLTLYDATQGIFGDRERVASLLGMKPEDIHVISPFIGGGFGSKGPTWSHVVLTAMAARRVNRPVKLVLSREQMFGPIGFRSETRQTVKGGTDADGKLVSMSYDTLAQTSVFDEFTESSSVPARMLYTCPNQLTSHNLVRLNTGTPSFMRAPGESSGTFGLESFMDELAYELKMDPIELRLRNYAEQDPDKGKPFTSKSLRECYRQGAEKFGWSQRNPEPRSKRVGNTLVGWGMATAVYPSRRSPSAAKAILRADGSVLVLAGTQDLGTGSYTVFSQVAAETLGIPTSQVTFRLGDTDYPKTPVSGGSQTAASTGSAVRIVCQSLQEKVIQMAVSDAQSPLNGVSAQSVTFDQARDAVAALLKRRGVEQVDVTADTKPGPEKDQYSGYAFGAQFAEVHVDADLGMVRVNRMVGAFGAGRILNAKTARSQLLGGMIWGIGMALTEHTIMDEPRGRYVNMNLAEYHVPVNADAPEIDVIFVPEDDQHINPIGVKGVGEIGITGATAAIANAVFHATGKRIREIPITPDKLL